MPLGDELVIILGTTLAPGAIEKLQSFGGAVDRIQKSASRAALAVSAYAASATVFISKVVNSANELQKLSDETGVSTTTLQEWAYAAAHAGVSISSVQKDLVGLTKSMASPIPGQFNVNLALLGVSAYKAGGGLKTASEVLGEIGDKLATMSPQRSAQWASKVGISDDTLLMLRQGGDALERLRKEAHAVGAIIPEAQVKRAAEFKRSFSELITIVKTFATAVTINTLPALEKLLFWTKEWLRLNQYWLSLRLGTITGGLAIAFSEVARSVRDSLGFFKPLLDVVEKIIGPFDEMETWAHVFVGLMGFIAVVFSPVIASAALLAAKIYLVQLAIEDLYFFFTGKKSLTGTWIDYLAEKMPHVAELAERVKKAVSSLLDSISFDSGDIFKKWTDTVSKAFGGLLGVFDDLAKEFNAWVDNFQERYPTITRIAGAISKAFGGLGGSLNIVVSAFEKLLELLKLAGNTTGFAFGKILDLVEYLLKSGEDSFVKGGYKKDQVGPYSRNLDGGQELSPSVRREDTRNIFAELAATTQSIFSGLNVQKYDAESIPVRMPAMNSNRFELTQNIITNDPMTAALLSVEYYKDFSRLNTPGMGPSVVR